MAPITRNSALKMAKRHDMKPHEMTWRQYRDAQREAVRAKYECSKAEAAECRPDATMKSEWLQHVVRAAEAGNAISSHILDNIAKSGLWWQFVRDARDYTPPVSYMLPWVRSQPSATDVRKGRVPENAGDST
jgi:hypothetical protein